MNFAISFDMTSAKNCCNSHSEQIFCFIVSMLPAFETQATSKQENRQSAPSNYSSRTPYLFAALRKTSEYIPPLPMRPNTPVFYSGINFGYAYW